MSALLSRVATSPFKPTILSGHAAIITGGASGIGLEIARQLGLHGASVTLMGRRGEVLEAARKGLQSQGIKCHTVRGDVRSTADAQRCVSETLEAFGSLSILVNSAAGNFLAIAEDLAPKGFQTVMDIDGADDISAESHCRILLQSSLESWHHLARIWRVPLLTLISLSRVLLSYVPNRLSKRSHSARRVHHVFRLFSRAAASL